MLAEFEKTWPLIREILIWSVGDDTRIRCWRDPWVPRVGSLANILSGRSSLDMECFLSDMVNENGEWNLDIFRLRLPEEVIRKIVRIPPPHPTTGVDKIIWEGIPPDCFSLKNAYEKLREWSWNLKEPMWRIT